MSTFLLPDLGEGLPDAQIVEWFVKEGDTVAKDQPLVSMETAKAVVEVPSPNSGKIKKLHGKPGDIILTKNPLVEFEGGEESKSADTGTVAGKIEQSDTIIAQNIATNRDGVKILPAIRALAKKMKVDINSVFPTGPNNTITKEDILNANDNSSDDGYEPLVGTRRTMARVMVQSHQEIVPVTIFDQANVSHWQSQDITARLIQAICDACKSEPALNAWFNTHKFARRVHDSVNLGLAIDTDDGLFVPVINSADKKTLKELRQDIDDLKSKVSDRTIEPSAMQGFTIILSNFGKFAGQFATPIVVPPSVAILATGKLVYEIAMVNNEPQEQKILPLSLSFDHRAVTGGEATRFMGKVLESLAK